MTRKKSKIPPGGKIERFTWKIPPGGIFEKIIQAYSKTIHLYFP